MHYLHTNVGASAALVMDNTNPSSSLARTLGDFLPEALREADSEWDGAPPLNDSYFANLGGGRGRTVSCG